MHTNGHTPSIGIHTDTHLSASYQSSLMKSGIKAGLGSQSRTDRDSGRRG